MDLYFVFQRLRERKRIGFTLVSKTVGTKNETLQYLYLKQVQIPMNQSLISSPSSLASVLMINEWVKIIKI